ncbi:MAG: TIGR04282 family arsenosugar biosynthesis glycosyltransferase [Myxococcota bacterium]
MSAGTTGALIVFAKDPVPGRVKTRLVPPFTPRQAAEFYAAMLDDVLEASSRFARVYGLTPILAIDPPEAVGSIAARVPTDYRVIPQRGANLAERMAWAVRDAAAGGANRILLRGSDSPVLDGEKFGEALRILDEAALVVCPDLDGGYNMVGLRRPALGLFDHPMSTRTALEDTLANAAALGMTSQLQQPSFDIDIAEDLVWLARARSGPAHESVTRLCPNALAYLDTANLWPDAASL